MQTEPNTQVIKEERITDPSMSATPRRISMLRVAVIAALVLAALGFAGAVYLDNAKGSLTDEQGIISD